MFNKIFKLFALNSLILLALWSCTPSDSYIISVQAHLRAIEREDHQACVAQGVDFGDWDNISTELYWRCRYNLIQDRMIHHATTAADIENNTMIKRISKKILTNLKRSRQAVLSDVENDIEVFDHSKCLALGYKLNSNDQQKDQKYYNCREKLISQRTPVAPGITNSYANSVLPASQLDLYLKHVKQNKFNRKDAFLTHQATKLYPRCNHINTKSTLFAKCSKAQDESYACLKKVPTLKAKKRLNDEIYCQQQAFIQFPDNYSLVRTKSRDEIGRIEKKQREEKIAQLKKQREDELIRVQKFFEAGYVSQDINLHDRNNVNEAEKKKKAVYEKIEILHLREEFIAKCSELTKGKLSYYVEEETDSCVKIATDWDGDNEDWR